MHPLAAPGTLWVLSSDGKYLVRPQADETSHKKLIPCGRQGKELYFLFSVSQRVSPLRRRPKGFPIALWKPSAPLLRKGICTTKNGGLVKGKERAFLVPSCFTEDFASAEATKGLSGRPLETFGPLAAQGNLYNKKWGSYERQGKGLPCIFLFHRGFRLCGGDQRAFRSPFGNLRPLCSK